MLMLLQQSKNRWIEKLASAYINPEKEVKTVQDAVAGAKDIIANRFPDDMTYRSWIAI